MDATPPQSSVRSTWWFLAALVGLCVLASFPLLEAGWIWDDDSYVTRNAILTDPEGLQAIWIPGVTPQYYPLVFTTFWIEAQLVTQLTGSDDLSVAPFTFHLVNILLHLGSAVLLWRTLVAMGFRDERLQAAAWLAAALFLVHPMQVESVGWVSERKNVLALCLALASLRCWLAKDAAVEGQRAGWYVASLTLFALAMLSKTMVAALAPALLAIDAWRRVPLTGRRLASILPFFLVGVPLGLLTLWIEVHHVGASGEEFALSFADRLVLAPRSALWYVWTWLWPQNLAFIYERFAVDARVAAQWIPLGLAAVAVAASCVAWRRGWRGPLVLLSIFVAAVFPALGFFNVYPFRFSYVADHFAYVGTVALAVGSGWLLATLAARWPRRGAFAGAAALLVGLAAVSATQATAYRDEETLWRRTLAVNPAAAMPASNLAGLLATRAGSTDDPERKKSIAAEAERFARQAVALEPTSFGAWTHLSESLRLQGRYAEALEAAQESLKQNATIPDTHWAIGRLLELQGEREAAVESYRQGAILPEAVRSDIADPRQRLVRMRDYARILTILGRDAGAAVAWREILALTPDDSMVHGNIALASERLGDWPRAREHFKAAIAHAPTNTPEGRQLVLQLLPRLVNALLTPPSSPDDCADALQGSRFLVEQTARRDALALLLLARAEQANGIATANATFAEATEKAADPLLPEALRAEIAKFAPLFASSPR